MKTAGVSIAAGVLACGGWTSAAAQQSPAATPPTAFLAGQVVEQPSGRGIAGVTISLNSASAGRAGGPQRPVITDSQGRFYFANLAAGTYSFQTIKAGYGPVPSAAPARTVPVAAAERITDLTINLVKLAAISGTLRDDAGDPVVGMSVLALRRTIANGRPAMASPGQARSDDRGVYRIAGLQPGEYVICACARDPLPLDGVLLTTLAAEPLQLLGVAGRALKVGASAASIDDTMRTFAPTLYPNSTTVARADRVTVKPGEDKINVDINLTAVRAVHISGTVAGSPGPVNAASLRLTPNGESDEGATLLQMTPMLMQPDGRFDFVNVPSGSYVLNATVTVTANAGAGAPTGTAMTLLGRAAGAPPPPARRDLTDPVMFASVPIVAGDRDVDGVAVALKTGSAVSGRLEVSGNAVLPPAQILTRGFVMAGMMNAPPGQQPNSFGGAINADGTFRIAYLPPGRYGFTVVNIQGLPLIKGIEVGGVDMVDMPIDVESDLTDVALTLSAVAPGTILGTVARTGPPEDLVALVFPSDRKYWTDPSAAFRRMRAAAVTRDGSFTAGSLSAGDYFIAIVPDAQSVDWQQTARFEALSKAATKVTLADGEKKTVEVKR
jgi:hypothetical protein